MLVSHVTDSLDRQELMLDIVGSSIKKAGKKLHRLELMMHNEPAEDAEMRDKVAWHEKMNHLLHYDVVKRLPTLREVKILKYQKQKTLLQKKTGHTTLMENLKRPNSRHHLEGKSLERFRESKKEKEPGPSLYLGSTPEGEVIRVVKNYNGANTSHCRDRTLVKKDGRYGKANVPRSSLPEWFHPGYYNTENSVNKSSSGIHQLAFKSVGRNHVRRDQESRTRELEQRALLYQAAEDAAIARGEAKRKPGYFSSNQCKRPHSKMSTSEWQSQSTWSRYSADSTIGRPATQSGMRSPQTTHLSNHGEHLNGCIAYDEVVSEFLDGQSTNYSVRSSSNSPSIGDMLSTSSVDSVLIKASHRNRAKYQMKDYTMGALELQECRQLVIPEPVEESSPPHRVFDGGKSRGTTVTVTTMSAPLQRVSRSRAKSRTVSRAATVLREAKQDLVSSTGSVVFDEDIPFSQSMNGFVEKWRGERNLVSLDPIRPKSSIPRDPPKNVDFHHLLIDNNTLSEEESKSLVSEFSKEFTDQLSFL